MTPHFPRHPEYHVITPFLSGRDSLVFDMSFENRVRSISLLPTTTIMSVHARVHHPALRTSFIGVDHPLSTDDAPIVQFRGIQYAFIAARFRQSKLVTSYPAVTDASRYGFVSLHLCLRAALTRSAALSVLRSSTSPSKRKCLAVRRTMPPLSSSSRTNLSV
jgi:hypothetical protein